jgi:hypothetical protein
MLPHASSNRTEGTSIAIVIAAPVLWLLMVETAYLVSHWSCGTGMKWPLQAVIAGTTLLLAGALWMRPRAASGESISGFLSSMALWMAVGFILVVVASAIQPAIVHPCG